jgi:ribonuclease inhibitor
MNIEIFGKKINNEQDFHDQLAEALNVQQYYGGNLAALWDLLSVSVERPINLVWFDAMESKPKLGDVFDKIIAILEQVKLQDEKFGWDDKFTYTIK